MKGFVCSGTKRSDRTIATPSPAAQAQSGIIRDFSGKSIFLASAWAMMRGMNHSMICVLSASEPGDWKVT